MGDNPIYTLLLLCLCWPGLLPMLFVFLVARHFTIDLRRVISRRSTEPDL